MLDAMSETDTPTSLSDVFEKLLVADPERLMHAIYHELRRTYRFNADRHDEENGDDSSTFGFCVYRNSWHAVEKVLAQFGGEVKTSRPNNSLVIKTPGLLLKLYRGGADETFDIESYDTTSGSETKQRYTTDNSVQLELNLGLETVEPEGDAPNLENWMVVHSGNHEIGLENVWMGAPRTPTADNPSPWAFVVHLPDLCSLRGCTHGDMQTDTAVELGNSSAERRSHAELAEPKLIIERRVAEDDQ